MFVAVRRLVMAAQNDSAGLEAARAERILAQLAAAAACVALLLAISVAVASPSNAHSGGLDGSGGHNCNVGSCAGTYHCHRYYGGRCQRTTTPPSTTTARPATTTAPPTTTIAMTATTVAPTTTAGLSPEFVILVGEYSWGRSEGVASLQRVLGIRVDGEYGPKTREAHQQALAHLGVENYDFPLAPGETPSTTRAPPTTTTAPPTTTITATTTTTTAPPIEVPSGGGSDNETLLLLATIFGGGALFAAGRASR